MFELVNNFPSSLILPKNFKVKRVSSYDVTGGNVDCWQIKAGETKVIADIDGPGIISHIWFTIASPDKYYLRKILLKVYWDNEENPSICSPVGDFFGLGHAVPYTYQCAVFSTSCNDDGKPGMGVAMNCWLPMPFLKNARLEIVNEQEEDIRSFYFYIDYQKYNSLPGDVLYLHARWRRENPCDGWTGPGSIVGSPEWELRHQGPEGKNLSDEGNYLILEAEGRGHYIGVNMSIDHLHKGWWGEGDDMIFIDRDGERTWPPDLHGTGSEDYLCHAWGMQKVAHMYSGEPWCEIKEGNEHHYWGKVCVYRYHIVDPIPFEKNIRVSIEHGHANDRSDDYCSVAYWYQNEPHKPFPPILPARLRLPNP
ncbi:MAG: DUF2961 domain-containing protein [Clostridiaceae bacterium]|nr:DUF2961 domain-containing protein [Clostridiaceae bacterium]